MSRSPAIGPVRHVRGSDPDKSRSAPASPIEMSRSSTCAGAVGDRPDRPKAGLQAPRNAPSTWTIAVVRCSARNGKSLMFEWRAEAPHYLEPLVVPTSASASLSEMARSAAGPACRRLPAATWPSAGFGQIQMDHSARMDRGCITSRTAEDSARDHGREHTPANRPANILSPPRRNSSGCRFRLRNRIPG